MSVFIACACNQKELVPCVIADCFEDPSFELPPTDGWGVGFYQNGELLQETLPFPETSSPRLSDLIDHLECDLLIGHLRLGSAGDLRKENLHPFSFKNWLFAHNGTLPAFPQIREPLLEAMPSFIRRGIRGTTGSEHLFHLFLSFLYDAGMLERSDIPASAIQDALLKALSTVGLLASEKGQTQGPSSLIVSNGDVLVALRQGIPTYYTLVEGIEDCAICRRQTAQPGQDIRKVDHPNVRCVLVFSGMELKGRRWAEVPDASFITVSSSLAFDIFSLK